MKAKPEAVNHPAHYNAHPSGVECIDIVEHLTFNVGTAIKHMWRAGLTADVKGKDGAGAEMHVEDLRKAVWYLNREIERLTKA